MKREMNSVLQAGAEEEQIQERRQDKLKKKFGIKDKDVVIVERNNTFKFTISTLAAILRFAATVIVIALALVGITAMFYEAPRRELLIIFNDVLEQINEAIPIRGFIQKAQIALTYSQYLSNR